MFAKMGEYEACGIFTVGHFILIAITLTGIFVALKYSAHKTKEEVHKIIQETTVIACLLEIVKIALSIKQNSLRAVNTYVPLYYCSIFLYAGLFSSFAKGTLKRVGDVCLATGSIIGGLIFILYPSTSLPMYPAFHFFSIHSFLFHGTMVYLGILLNKTRYVELRLEDGKYFAILIFGMSIAALVVNHFFDGNLMFISHNFPGTPIEFLYNITNGGFFFTSIMVVLQMTLPFYVSYYVVKKIHSAEDKKQPTPREILEKEVAEIKR